MENFDYVNRDRNSLMEELFGSSSEGDNDVFAEDESHNQDGEINAILGSENIEDGPEEGNPEDGPQQGMIFSSLETLFNAYQDHARSKGFCIIKRSTRKGNESSGKKYVTMACDRGRKANAIKVTKRINCPAKICAIMEESGSLIVSKVCSNHNHELEPHNSILMSGHRSMSINMKRQLEANDIAGLRPCKNVRLLEVQCGGPENLGCLPKDCRNYIENRRRLRLGDGDAEAIRKLFLRMQQKDRDFFHLMDLDDEGRLRNVLWIHPRSKAAYEEFHDVISFDTTYLVNRYRMPFATVVGINHHGHSILLGCALVTHEDSSSFKWIFSNWLEAMGNIHPTAILTDQCESIKIAIREVMPNTIHRYCLWHIMSKLPQKFKNVADFDKKMLEFKAIVYDSLTIDAFERKWSEFIRNNQLENNVWLQNLFNERESWASVYLNHIFWAGMVSTQRSKGMHAYFDGYIHSMSTLKQFVEQYEIAISNKIQKEFRSDHDSKHKVIRCISIFPWEKQFQRAYTNSVFKLIQEEIRRIWYCHIVPPTQEEIEAMDNVEIESHKVLERSLMNNYYYKQFTYSVEYRPSGDYLSCNCRKFEFKGILCCHIMKVMSMKDIRNVNERYMLSRWRKDIQRRHSSIFFAGGYPHMTEEYKKFQEVEGFFQQCTDLAMDSLEKMEFIKQRCIDFKNELLNWNPALTSRAASSTPVMQQDIDGIPVLNPQVTRPRGRPRANRFISASEGNKTLMEYQC